MNRHNYINKNGDPAICWIAKATHMFAHCPCNDGEWHIQRLPRDEDQEVWYVRAATKQSKSPALIYTAHSYIEARAKQLVFLEKAKRNVKR